VARCSRGSSNRVTPNGFKAVPRPSFIKLTAPDDGLAALVNHDALDPDHLRQRGAWISGCTQRPNPLLGSDAADVARASKLPHAVQDINRHVDFGHPTFVYT
jgi:hypothetical protein